MNQEYNEQDLINQFKELKQSGSHKKSLKAWHVILLFLLLSIITIVLINYQALFSTSEYWFSVNFQNASFENPKITKVILNNEDPSSLLTEVPLNSIYIDKINIKAPIVFDIPNKEPNIQNNLKNGVIHLKGTAHPGEIGNVFITGHSSNFFWEAGKYKQIFSLLGNLKAGDNIVINYRNILYFYQVTSKSVVSADNLEVLKQTDDSILTLMTCYPVGTNYRRLIIKTKQVKPDPTKNIVRTATALESLPNINR